MRYQEAAGVRGSEDLWRVAWDLDVVGNCACPLTEDEVREVFEQCQPVGGPEDNLGALKVALAEACEAAWTMGRTG